jgi:hypothetical protein
MQLPFYTVLRLWDCFMLDGYAVVSAAALAVMLTHEGLAGECGLRGRPDSQPVVSCDVLQTSC